MIFSGAILKGSWQPVDVLPGSYVALLTSDERASIEARTAGLHLRDTMLLLGPAQSVSFAFLFRAPMLSTVVENVIAHGTGALHIDACRIAGDMSEFFSKTGKPRSGMGHAKGYGMGDGYGGDRANPPHSAGRWPSNLAFIQSTEYTASLDQQSGDRPSTLTGRADPLAAHGHPSQAVTDSWFSGGAAKDTLVYADAGGASRFFLQFANEVEFLSWLRCLLVPEGAPIFEVP
jgi:hypothetical protein